MRALRGDYHVAPFYDAGVAGVADLDDCLGGVDVGEVGAAGHDNGVGFADYFGAFGDEDCFGHFVGACIDEYDVSSSCGGGDDVLKSDGVVCYPITFGSARADAFERSGRKGVVLRFRSLVILRATEE